MLHGVFKALLKGTIDRGEGGVLFVRGDECAYRFPSEFQDQNFATNLQDLVDERADLFFVVEEREGSLHVVAYEKERVHREVAESIAAGTSIIGSDGTQCVEDCGGDAAPGEGGTDDPTTLQDEVSHNDVQNQ